MECDHTWLYANSLQQLVIFFRDCVDLVVKNHAHLPDPGIPAKIFQSIRHVVGGRLAKRKDLSRMNDMIHSTHDFVMSFAESPGIKDDKVTHELLFKHFYTVAANGGRPHLEERDFVDRYRLCCSGWVTSTVLLFFFL